MSARAYLGAFLVLATLAVSCNRSRQAGEPAENVQSSPMNSIAEQYIRLTLAVGQHDPDYVDAYYGPPEWKPTDGKTPLDDLFAQVTALREQAGRIPSPADELEKLRHHYLQAQLSAMHARLRMLNGERLTFDEESRALYDASAPARPESYFQAIVDDYVKRRYGVALADATQGE